MVETFQTFSRCGVQYLLISGQATVLYGAAEFSEDLDLWVDPRQENLDRVLNALGQLQARVGALTPPLTEANARCGHGFHFIVTESDGQRWPVDILGQPPRVGEFEEAYDEAVSSVPSLPELKSIDCFRLVALKKTDRERDYPIIARLVEIMVEDWLQRGTVTPEQIRWACCEARSAPPFYLLRDLPHFAEVFRSCGRPCLRVISESLSQNSLLDDTLLEHFQAALDEEKRQLQRESREYWRGIIARLKELRRGGLLLPEGVLVQDLP